MRVIGWIKGRAGWGREVRKWRRSWKEGKENEGWGEEND